MGNLIYMIPKFLDKWVVFLQKIKNTTGFFFVEINHYLRLRSFKVAPFAGYCYTAI